jgi:hypothetical protein
VLQMFAKHVCWEMKIIDAKAQSRMLKTCLNEEKLRHPRPRNILDEDEKRASSDQPQGDFNGNKKRALFSEPTAPAPHSNLSKEPSCGVVQKHRNDRTCFARIEHVADWRCLSLVGVHQTDTRIGLEKDKPFSTGISCS